MPFSTYCPKVCRNLARRRKLLLAILLGVYIDLGKTDLAKILRHLS